MCYNVGVIAKKFKRTIGGTPLQRGGDALSISETLMFSVAFATLIVTVITVNQKK